MTYAEFILLFVILPTAVMICAMRLMRRRGHLQTIDVRHHWRGIAILAVIAFIWTTPWDNYLIATGVWNSPADRIIGRIGYVPIEEYAFFLLMPLFNGAVIYWLLGFLPMSASTWRIPQLRERVAALFAGVLLFCGGIYSLRNESGTYLGLILVWLTPPLLIQWLFDPAALMRGKRIVLMGTLLPAIYFAVVDWVAIRQGIWQISATKTIGLGLPQLPLEEVLFFAIISLLLAQGIVLWHSIKPPNSVS